MYRGQKSSTTAVWTLISAHTVVYKAFPSARYDAQGVAMVHEAVMPLVRMHLGVYHARLDDPGHWASRSASFALRTGLLALSPWSGGTATATTPINQESTPATQCL